MITDNSGNDHDNDSALQTNDRLESRLDETTIKLQLPSNRFSFSSLFNNYRLEGQLDGQAWTFFVSYLMCRPGV